MQKRMQVTNAQLDELLQSGPTYYLPATSSHKNSAISHPGAPPRHSTTRLPRCSSYSRDFPLHELILPVFGFNVNKIIQCVLFFGPGFFYLTFCFQHVFKLWRVSTDENTTVYHSFSVQSPVGGCLRFFYSGLIMNWAAVNVV